MKTMKVNNVLVIAFFLTVFISCGKKDDTPEPATESSQNNIKSFTFSDFTPPLQGVVDTSAKTISITLPPATDPSSLKPTIELYDTKSSVSPATQTLNNFLTSTTYKVTAENGSIANYNVILKRPTASSKDAPTPPKYLCIFYAWPSSINGSGGNTTNAINIFKDYDIIVLGDGIWKTTHGDNTKTKTIIAGIKSLKPSVKIYGYIDVSTSIQNLSETQLKAAIDGWLQMGVTGVFGDDFDSDYGVNRKRQNIFIDYAHSKGLSVFANGFIIEDVLGGTDCHLNNTDYYLMESFFISDGSYTSLQSNIDKANKAYYYMRTKGIGIACVARDLSANVTSTTNQTDKFKQSWYATAMYNFDAFQYTNKNFCAQNEQLYYFLNPITSYGTSWNDFDWVRKVTDSKYERNTNNTTLYVNGDGATNGTGGH